MDQFELFEMIAKSAGLAAAILFMGCVLLTWLYRMERADRREAWKSHNELAKETNKVLSDLTVVMEGLKHEVTKKGR